MLQIDPQGDSLSNSVLFWFFLSYLTCGIDLDKFNGNNKSFLGWESTVLHERECAHAPGAGLRNSAAWETLHGQGHLSGVRDPFTALAVCIEREEAHILELSFPRLPFPVTVLLPNTVPLHDLRLKEWHETFRGTKETQKPLHVHIWIKFRL